MESTVNNPSIKSRLKFLVLLENEDQYVVFCETQKHHTEHDYLFCPLTVKAILLCEAKDLPYVLPENCFSEKEYYQYKEASENYVKDLILKINHHYAPISIEKIGFELEIGNYFFFVLYHILGALHYRAFMLNAIIAYSRPDKIVSFIENNKKKGNEIHGIDASYSELLSHSKHKTILNIIAYEPDKLQKSGLIKPQFYKKLNVENLSPYNLIKKLVKKSDLLSKFTIKLINNTKFGIVRNILKNYQKRILVVGPFYNWFYVLNDARSRQKFAVSWIGDGEFIKPKKESNRNLFEEWFRWDGTFLGFQLAPHLFSRMETVQLTASRMMRDFAKTKKRISKHDIVVTSIAPFPFQNYFLHIAKYCNKPVVFYQHGEMNLYPDSLFSEASELLYISHYFSYGDGASKKYDSYIGERGFKGPISIGSASFEKQLRTEEIQGQYILYATGKYMSHGAPFAASIAPDTRLLKSQETLLNYFEELISLDSEQKVIWKLNNTPGASEVPFQVNNIQIIHFEKKFTELISEAKLIVLDAPATTCLEVCVTRKPLFVLLNRIKWFPEAEMLLKKRAVVSYSPDELVKQIDKFIHEGIYLADVDNREFIRSYGTHLDDGNSAERAINFLNDL
jgi:hypothetical protein